MSSSRLKEIRKRPQPGSREPSAADLVVDKEAEAFKAVQEAHATGKQLDLTSMTDQELMDYIAGRP